MRCDASQPHSRVLSKAPRCRVATDQPTIGATQWLRTCKYNLPLPPPSAKKIHHPSVRVCCVSKSLGMKGPLFSKLSTVLISNLKLSQKLGFDALLSPIPQLIKMLRAKGKLERVDIDEGGKCRRSLDPSRYQQGG